jgi:hypothetical protein
MARATVVYLILNEDRQPEYAFTVRHEAQTTWERRALGAKGYTAIRLRDGDRMYPDPDRRVSPCDLDKDRDGAFV